MSDIIEPLVHDLVAWCGLEPRPYAEVLDAWRTSCPRLMVWEEAVARGLVETRPGGPGLIVVVTERGRDVLAAAGARPQAARSPVAARV